MNQLLRTFGVLLAVAPMAIAQAPQTSTSGKAAQITAAHKKRLAAAHLKVMVPAYVPVGFKLKNFSLENDKDPLVRYWSIRYEKPGTKANLIVQMASDGIGDPMFDLPNGDVVDPTGAIPGRNPVFGKFELMYVAKPAMWAITWYELPGKSMPRYVIAMGDGLSKEEGKKVVESLRWLR